MGYNQDRNGANSGIVEEIKSKVTIPMYFNEVILPARQSYYSDYHVDLESVNRTLCPLHDEDTPSFYYREELGTYKCFGCGAYGDVISLHQKFTEIETGTKVTFKDALTFLKKVFIDQGEVAEAIKGPVKIELDPMKLTYMNSMYASAIKAIMSDESLDNHTKAHLMCTAQSLREFAYQHGNETIDYVADELRKYSRARA